MLCEVADVKAGLREVADAKATVHQKWRQHAERPMLRGVANTEATVCQKKAECKAAAAKSELPESGYLWAGREEAQAAK